LLQGNELRSVRQQLYISYEFHVLNMQHGKQEVKG
jgi:hypothetical protein